MPYNPSQAEINGNSTVAPGLPIITEGTYVRVEFLANQIDIGPADLRPADLLLMSAPNRAHVAIYLGQGQIIKATSYGVSIQHLPQALQDEQVVGAWRRQGLSPAEAETLVGWLRTQDGRPYEMAPSTLGQGSAQGVWYCSELVLAGFKNIGKPLIGDDPNLSLPGYAVTLASINYVGHLKRPGLAQPMPIQQSRQLGPFTPDETDRDTMIPAGSYGQTVNASILEVADLIVVSSDHALSEAIRQRTSSPASHIALYIGNGEVIEAIASGVEKRSLATVLSETHYAAAYRYVGLSDNEKNQIKNFAVGEWQRGAKYDFLVIASLQSTQDDDAWFCSELVFAAFSSAGITLGDSAQSTPGQVINMQGVEYLGHLPAQGDSTMSLTRTHHHARTRSRPLQNGGTMAALGFEILKSVVTGSAGAITYNFDQLRGKYSVRYPRWTEQERLDHDAPAHPYTTVQMESRQSHWDLGTISATVPISFDYNGHYISNLRLSRPGTNEHFAYSIDIAGEISENRNFWNNSAGELVSRVDLKITHVIDYDWLGESFYDDTAEIIENYHIYSDGSVWCTVVVQGTWWFDSSDAQTPIRIQNGELHISGPHSVLVERQRQVAAGATSMMTGSSSSQPMPPGEFNYSQPIPPGQSVYWESEPFRVHGSGAQPAQSSALVASYRPRGMTARPRMLSSGNGRTENAVQAAMRHGASEDEARAFFAHEAALSRRGARAMTAGNAFPAISMIDGDGWIAGILDEAARLAFPADSNPLQILFDFCTNNNLTIAIGLTAGVGFYEAADVGLGIVFAPGNQIGYYGSVSAGVGWNFEASAGIQITVIEGGSSTFTGSSLVIGGSLDLSEGPSIGLRAILNTSGNLIGWTAEVTWTIGVPAASAIEFTVSIQQTHASFTRVRTQSFALPQALGTPMIGGLPLRPKGVAQMATQQNNGWASRRSANNMRGERRRIWA